MPKVSIVGAGKVGSTTAFSLMKEKLADEIVLVDIAEDLAKGEALDLAHCGCTVIGTKDYEKTADSDLAIIIAGIGRKPDQTRLQLAETNAKIVSSVAKDLVKYSPNIKILVVTNPVDVMTYVVWKSSGLPKERIFGQGNLLDSFRFRYIISQKTNKPVDHVHAIVVGEHGDSMVPLFSSVRINGENLDSSKIGKLGDIREEIKSTNNKVLELKKATYYGPAIAITDIVRAVLHDEKKVLPVSVYLEEHGIYAGALAKVGKEGIEEIITPDMVEEEKSQFLKSIETIKNAVNEISDKL